MPRASLLSSSPSCDAPPSLARPPLAPRQQRLALGEYRLQRAIYSMRHRQKQAAVYAWSGVLFDFAAWTRKHEEEKVTLKNWRDSVSARAGVRRGGAEDWGMAAGAVV